MGDDLKSWLKGKVAVLAQVGDMDACSAMVAFKELAERLNPKIELEFGFPGALNRDGNKILQLFKLKTKLLDDIPLEEIEKVILLDTQPNAIPDFLQTRAEQGSARRSGTESSAREKDLFVIDHHIPTSKNISGVIDETAVATTEVVHGLFKKYKVKLTKDVARAIIYGLISDTAGLRFAKAKTFGLLFDLLSEFGLEYTKILEDIYEEKDKSERLAVLTAARRLEIKDVGGKIVVISYVGGSESSAAGKLLGLGADIVLITSRKPQETRVIGRARSGFNLAEIFTHVASQVGGSGGGHAGACAMNIPEQKEKEAMSKILQALR